jgi:hypothetical protein
LPSAFDAAAGPPEGGLRIRGVGAGCQPAQELAPSTVLQPTDDRFSPGDASSTNIPIDSWLM